MTTTPTTPTNTRALEIQTIVLREIAEGRDLDAVLSNVCLLVEEACGGVCSALLVGPSGGALHPGVSPSNSPEALKALDGLCIAPASGSCGTAAYTGSLEIVEDTATDHRWVASALQEFATRFHVRACWSSPFFSSSNGAGKQVLGTFAISHPQPGKPSDDDKCILETAALLAGIAVERERVATKAREREAKLVQSERMAAMGQLAAGMVHELNNQLSIIKMFGVFLDRSLQGTDQARDVGEIMTATSKSEEILQELVSFSRGQSLQVMEVDANQIAKSAAVAIPEQIDSEAVVGFTPSAGPCMIAVDEKKLSHVLVQLARRSLKRSRTSRGLTLSVTSDGTNATIRLSHEVTIEDAKVATEQSQSFEPFAPNDTSPGLTLASCHGSIAQQGGALSMESSIQEESYIIQLPLAGAAS